MSFNQVLIICELPGENILEFEFGLLCNDSTSGMSCSTDMNMWFIQISGIMCSTDIYEQVDNVHFNIVFSYLIRCWFLAKCI